ncbi:hypothetical protein DER45DRAFT_540100 [Fusarium avenaceum]|nr:hypothetical protein DER45DRAFT_540100 [Fusarium avenaceum]
MAVTKYHIMQDITMSQPTHQPSHPSESRYRPTAPSQMQDDNHLIPDELYSGLSSMPHCYTETDEDEVQTPSDGSNKGIKLGYRRSSIACVYHEGHCRRRKIRCISTSAPTAQDPCQNCQRLNKECSLVTFGRTYLENIRTRRTPRPSAKAVEIPTASPPTLTAINLPNVQASSELDYGFLQGFHTEQMLFSMMDQSPSPGSSVSEQLAQYDFPILMPQSISQPMPLFESIPGTCSGQIEPTWEKIIHPGQSLSYGVGDITHQLPMVHYGQAENSFCDSANTQSAPVNSQIPGFDAAALCHYTPTQSFDTGADPFQCYTAQTGTEPHLNNICQSSSNAYFGGYINDDSGQSYVS